MDDQDDINLEGGDVASGDGGGKKGPGILPQLLKWVAIVVAALIFIVTIVVITYSVLEGSGDKQTVIHTSEEYRGLREVLQWYDAVGVIRTRTMDDIPTSVIVDARLGYNFDDKATPAELSSRLVELKDYLRRYFTHKTAEELRNEERIKLEIRDGINDNILSRSRIKDVRFVQYEITSSQ